jgi:hypothetical protein
MTATKAPRFGHWQLRVDRVVTTTITLMSVLIIYDGWGTLELLDVTVVIVGPVVAIFLSHVFAAVLEHRVTFGRSLTRDERRGLLAAESVFLLWAVPPLVILFVLSAAGFPYSRTIRVIVLAGVVSLGFWGGLAGRRSGLTGWSWVASVLSGLGVGATVLVLQAVLQPGQNPFQP